MTDGPRKKGLPGTMPYVLIALMGFIGATLRYALELAFGGWAFPVGTLLINIFGCFTLEIIYNFVGTRLHVRPDMIKAMGVGLLGAFSTLSAFTSESVNMLVNGQFVIAGLYILVTLVLCFLASLAGNYTSNFLALMRLKRFQRRRRLRREKVSR